MKNLIITIVMFVVATSTFLSCRKVERMKNEDIVLSNDLLTSNLIFENAGSKFSIYNAALLSNGKTVVYGTMGSYIRGLAIIGVDGSIEKMIEINERFNFVKVVDNPELGGSEVILVGGYTDADSDGFADVNMAVLKVYDINLTLINDLSSQIRTQSVNSITDFTINNTSDRNEIFFATGTNKIVYHDLNSQATKSTIYTNIGNPQLSDIYLSESINNSHDLIIGGVEYEDETFKKSVAYKGIYNSLSNEFVLENVFYDTRECNELCKMLVSPYSGNIVLVSKVYDYNRPIGQSYWMDIKITAFDKNGNLVRDKQLVSIHSNKPEDAILINGTVFIACNANSYYRTATNFNYGLGAVITYDYINDVEFKNYFGNPERNNGFNKILDSNTGQLHLFGYYDNLTTNSEDYSDWYVDPEGFNAWYCILPYGSIYEPPPLPPDEGTGD